MRRVDTDIQASKKLLRRQCQQRRAALEPGYVAAVGRQVRERLLGMEEYVGAEWVHSYVSLGEKGEVDTLGFIEESLARGKGVVVPVVVEEERHLRHARIKGLGELRPGHLGLLQPELARADWFVDVGELDLVVVPGLAFDVRGNRIGYGAGYYDRFLPQVRGCKVGLAYESFLLEDIPLEDHDVPMDVVVVNSTVYRGGVP